MVNIDHTKVRWALWDSPDNAYGAGQGIPSVEAVSGGARPSDLPRAALSIPLVSYPAQICDLPPVILYCSDLRGEGALLMETFRRMFDALFGCHHQQLSRVFTIQKHTYQVGIACGREFGYSWESMHSNRALVADYAAAGQNRTRHADISAL